MTIFSCFSMFYIHLYSIYPHVFHCVSFGFIAISHPYSEPHFSPWRLWVQEHHLLQLGHSSSPDGPGVSPMVLSRNCVQ
jgi:hypothetical protein